MIHVLRTLAPLLLPNIATGKQALDLHVLSTPPAFVLSQNQTLRRKFYLPWQPAKPATSDKNSDQKSILASLFRQMPDQEQVLSVIKIVRIKRIWRITHNTIFADITILKFLKNSEPNFQWTSFLFASGDKKTQLELRLNWSLPPSIQPGQNWANLKSLKKTRRTPLAFQRASAFNGEV